MDVQVPPRQPQLQNNDDQTKILSQHHKGLLDSTFEFYSFISFKIWIWNIDVLIPSFQNKDQSYKSIYNSLESIVKEKTEIQDKLEKQRRKAQKSLIKLEQQEVSFL